MKILIAYDGSDCAKAALDDLGRAGMPREADATILSVSEVWLPLAHNSATRTSAAQPGLPRQTLRSAAATTQPVTEILALALQARSRLQSHFPAWNINAEESSGSPAREILKRASELQSDLIVLGSHGHSGLGRFLLGSVSQKVVNEAPCSVRVARGTVWKNGAPVRILLGLDGSCGSLAAVDVIAGRAWPIASEVRIVTVIDPHTSGTAPQLPAGQLCVADEHVDEFIRRATRKLADAELTVTSKIETGDPKRLLVAAAEEWGAECVFIGASCEPTPFGRLLLGTVATAVVARAQCSVEVVRLASADRPSH
jgi:nucleotide-binding universal stress UspA family protein